MRKSKGMFGVLLVACLALTLAACQPGSGTTNSATSANETASTPAPIHVPEGYQGIVQITFTPTTTYAQAVSVLEKARMRLQVLCPNPGPILADPPASPTPITQESDFAKTHQLTAIGIPNLSQEMLEQVAASGVVTSIDKMPSAACPLAP